MLVVDQREEQMLQRRIFMTAFRCVGERVMEGGFQRSSKRRHFDFTPVGPRRPCLPPQRGSWTDRKSVVSGKSVSVRVDLGGRRSIKKNTQRSKHLPVIEINIT